MNLLSEILSEPITNALGWALVHSLWQGAILLFLAAFAMRLVRARSGVRSAAVQYGISVAALLGQLVAFILTVGITYKPGGPAPSADSIIWSSSLSATESAMTDRFAPVLKFLENQLPLLVTIWLLGTGFLLIRLLGGWFLVQRLSRHGVTVAPVAWQNYVGKLAGQLGIRPRVKLLESVQITVPMTIGWLRPVILLPVGLLTGLSPKQVEAVLAHELAHIRRYDYLINLVQSVVEVFFFYHPATWWLSAHIRQEREHCCDDVAIGICGDRASLAQALVRIEEKRVEATRAAVAPGLAMAFGARRPSLVERVKRVIGFSENRPSARQNSLLPLFFLILLGGLFINQRMLNRAANRNGFREKAIQSSLFGAGNNSLFGSSDLIAATDLKERVDGLVESLAKPMKAAGRKDTLLPATGEAMKEALNRYKSEIDRLETEMQRLQKPLQKLDRQLEIHNKSMQLSDAETRKLEHQTELLEKKQREFERKMADLDRDKMTGLPSEAQERQRKQIEAQFERVHQEIGRTRAVHMEEFARRMQDFQEKSRHLLSDSTQAIVSRLAGLQALHTAAMQRLTSVMIKLDSISIPPVPPVPALAPVAPAPAVSPAPAPRPPKGIREKMPPAKAAPPAPAAPAAPPILEEPADPGSEANGIKPATATKKSSSSRNARPAKASGKSSSTEQKPATAPAKSKQAPATSFNFFRNVMPSTMVLENDKC